MNTLTKNEAISLTVAIGVVVLMFFTTFGSIFSTTPEEVTAGENTDAVLLDGSENIEAQAAGALNEYGEVDKLIMQDAKVGEGDGVLVGDTITVHYRGALRDGTEFDNSFLRGTPYTFTIGEGVVIKGWDQGILGMKVGGERILVIPPSLAYGDRQLGPIPPNSTLLFSVTLLDIQK